MNRYSLLIVTIIVSLAATGFTQPLNFKVAGKDRSCVVHIPSGISNPAIIFFLHGSGGNGEGFEKDTKADVVADKEKFIAAYPSGISGSWGYSDGSSDFTFMRALIDTIDAKYHIDRNRVYVSGFSMGGGMTFALACKYADIFAAIAPVSAAGTACTPKRAIPVFLTFGTTDMYPTSTYMASANRWATSNGCPSTPQITRPYPASNPQSGVTRITYGPGAQGTYVVADSISGQGHQWPSSTNLNQAEEVWTFFKQFSLNSNTAIGKQPLAAAAREPVTASYSSGVVRLQGAGEKSQVGVMDTRGRLVATAVAAQRQFDFKNKSSGVYLVMVSGKEYPVALRVVVP